MPVVRSQRQVRLDPLPGARLTAHETAISQGAGVEEAKARTGEALADFGGKVANIAGSVYAQERKKDYDRANSVILMEGEKRIAQFYNTRMTAALQVKGKDAMPLPETVMGDFDKLANEIEAGLTNDDQRAAFAKIRTSKAMSMDLDLRRHVAGEMSAYAVGEAEALTNESLNLMAMHANDPKQADIDLTSAINATKQLAQAAGAGPEKTEKMIRDVMTAGHTSVIDRLLAADKSAEAQTYYDKKKDEINGSVRDEVETKLASGSRAEQSQQIAEAIIAKGGTLAEQQAAARELTKGKLRDEVNARLEHQAVLTDRAKQDAAEAASLKASNAIRRSGGNYFAVPAHEMDALPPATQSALLGFSKSLTAKTPVPTDIRLWDRLMTMSAEKPDEFQKLDLVQFVDRLSEEDIQRFSTIKANIINGKSAAAAKDDGRADFLSHRELIDTTLQHYGVQPSGQGQTDDEQEIVAQTQRLLQQSVNVYVQETGKKPPTTYIQAELDRLLSQRLTVKAPRWGTSLFGYTTSDKPITALAYGDIPAAEVERIKTRLGGFGMPTSEQAILDYYIRNLAFPQKQPAPPAMPGSPSRSSLLQKGKS